MSAARNSSYRLLVVDEDEVAASVRRMLQDDDVVVGASDVLHACHHIRQAEAGGHQFDAVLCRIDIDDTRGRTVLHVIRECSSPPMFIYMARYYDDGIETVRPAEGMLIKPFRAQELEDLMTKIVMERDRERTRRLLSDDYN